MGTISGIGSDQRYANFDLKVGSFNIQGQNNKSEIKLRKIKNILVRGHFDILLLQETRTDGTEKERKNGLRFSIPSKYI